MKTKRQSFIKLSIWGILTACLATLILVGLGVPVDLAMFAGCGSTLVAIIFAVIETFLKNGVK